MIDYEKLKEAHGLARQTDYVFDTTFGIEDPWFVVINVDDEARDYNKRIEFYDIEELISHLKSLPTTAAKHKVGQEVWLLNNFNEPVKAEILGRMAGDVELGFEDGTCRYGHTKELYHTLEELIDAQIERWITQKEEVQNASKCEKVVVGSLAKYSGATMCSCDHLILMNADGKPLICEKCGCDMSRIKLDWGSQG